MSMRPVLFVILSACSMQAPAHYVAPPSTTTTAHTVVEETGGGVSLDVDVDAEGKVKSEGFPAVSSDGHVVVAIQELGDGMRGFPNVVMRVFDATKGGAPTQTLKIVDVSDTADRPEDDGENFLLDRARPRLAAVRAILRDKRWITLAATGLDVTFDESQQLRVADSRTHRSLHARHVDGLDQKECVFEPYEPGAVSDPARRFLLVKVSYRSGPDWCNMDDDLDLVLVH
jgi:hypothetical protein